MLLSLLVLFVSTVVLFEGIFRARMFDIRFEGVVDDMLDFSEECSPPKRLGLTKDLKIESGQDMGKFIDLHGLR